MDGRAVARADDHGRVAAFGVLVDDPLAEPLDIDLAEIVGLCDRALVMYEGTVARELRGAALTEANLVSAAVGLVEAVSA